MSDYVDEYNMQSRIKILILAYKLKRFCYVKYHQEALIMAKKL